ncbi:MAG: hypothetical protein ACYDAO_08870 [Thermoplasmataceae archaeon]
MSLFSSQSNDEKTQKNSPGSAMSFQDLSKVGFNDQRTTIFLSLWNKFGNRSYLKKRGKKRIQKDLKALYVNMDRLTQEKTEIIENIEKIKAEIQGSGEEQKRLKTVILDSMEKNLQAKRLQYDEIESRFKFVNLLKTIVDTRSILGKSLISKVDKVINSKEMKNQIKSEVKSMAFNQAEVTNAIDDLDTSIETYCKSVEGERESEVIY